MSMNFNFTAQWDREGNSWVATCDMGPDGFIVTEAASLKTLADAVRNAASTHSRVLAASAKISVAVIV